MASTLDSIISKFMEMPEKARAEFEKDIYKNTANHTWFPNDGPQTQAYFSLADILLYGGQAGGGKTHLELGLAVQRHQRSIIFRRESSQTDGLETEGKKIIGASARYNGVDKEWEWEDGRSLKLAGMKEPDDWMKHAGRERDLIEFDEAGEFLEKQVRSMLGWLRGPEGQRCRMVLGSNPPRTADGLWMLKWFAPWLDSNFLNPALPGELRWCVFKKDEVVWVEGPGTSQIDGETYTHFSLTFIPASLEDNPYRNTPEYKARLQSLPEPLRSQLLYGDFTAGIRDDEYQVIPTDWITAAQNRWRPEIPQGCTMTAMALDPAGGGKDSAELAIRYGGWYAKLISAQGEETADGSKMAATVITHRRDDCPLVIDVGGGYGGKVIQRLEDNGITEMVKHYNGAEGSLLKTNDGMLAFANKRAEIHWRFREALDPDQEGGSAVCLPPDPELRAELAAPRWTLSARGILIEDKKDIKKRLGRSPGKSDAVMMCLSEANKIIARKYNNMNRPKLIQKYEDRKQRR